MASGLLIRNITLSDSASKTECHNLIDTATGTLSEIVNADIDASAAIGNDKLATIVTAGKVNTSALTTTSKAAGDFLYSPDGTTWARLPVGAATQRLQSGYDAYTKLIVHADCTDAGVAFTDGTAAGKTITNTATYDTYTKLMGHFCVSNIGDSTGVHPETDYNMTFSDSVYKFAGYSGVFNGTSSYITFPDHADWDFGSGDFTIDFWVRFVSITDEQTFCGQKEDATNRWRIYKSSHANNDKLEFEFLDGDDWKCLYETGAWTDCAINTWYHIVFGRYGQKAIVFVDGVEISSSNTAFSTNDVGDMAAVLTIGEGESDYLNGWLDELRISKGIARWTAAFTKPAYPYGQVITSTTSPKFGTASGYFGGSGEYLSLADSADWDFDADFTIDCWAKFNSTGSMDIAGNGYDTGWLLAYDTAGLLKFFAANSERSSHTFTPVVGTWYHLAVVRSDDDITMYVNGVSIGTDIYATAITSANALYIGYDITSQTIFDGYIDELRISKGIARWTAGFSVPTAAYPLLPVWVTP
jgi:hypothetical protein